MFYEEADQTILKHVPLNVVDLGCHYRYPSMADATSISDDINAGSELQLSGLLSSMITEYSVLVDKSQLPIVKEMKAKALQQVKLRIATSSLKRLSDKQILKKIANMKAHVKKKINAKRSNKQIALSHWEQELYNVLKGDENLSVTKTPRSVSTELHASSSCGHGSNVHSKCTRYKNEKNFKTSKSTRSVPVPATKRTYFLHETAETASLSTPELQRLVLLEQLKYTRMKMRRMEHQDEEDHTPTTPTHSTTYDLIDNFEQE